jgi:acetyl-CoA carboxylase biotin carboxylase subunit
MNTRLQVEHPVTEMVTGLDLVKQQIQIAAGMPLDLRQEDVQLKGSAVECRIYAEDPDNNFFPSPGTITVLRTPSGPGIRDDSGVYAGWTVPLDYDPLISKLVAWGATRDEAIQRMLRALHEYRVEGIQTNLGFFRELLNDDRFRKGDFDTSFLATWPQRVKTPTALPEFERDLAAIAAALQDAEETPAAELTPAPSSSWKREARLRGMRR